MARRASRWLDPAELGGGWLVEAIVAAIVGLAVGFWLAGLVGAPVVGALGYACMYKRILDDLGILP